VYEDLIGRETPIHITKYDGSFHRRWPGRFVLHKPPLFLLAFAAGDRISRTLDPVGDPDDYPARFGGDIYLFEDRWFNVARCKRDGRTWFYVNIATPVSFDGATFAYVDLDLDVSWYPDGAPYMWQGQRMHGGGPQVLDEDEFLAHSRSMGYPPTVVQQARAAVDEVLGLIRQRAFPFDRP